MLRPLLYGYQQVREGTDVEAGRRAMEVFAEREGYTLGDVFVDKDPERPWTALERLITVAQAGDAQAVLVSTPRDLGSLPRLQRLMRKRLEREAGVRVLVADTTNLAQPTPS